MKQLFNIVVFLLNALWHRCYQLAYIRNNKISTKEINPMISDVIDNSPLVLAAITEAVHRYYYDNITKDREKALSVGNLLTSLWCQNPNWRHVIAKYGKRYNPADTNAISIDSKPLINFGFKIELYNKKSIDFNE